MLDTLISSKTRLNLLIRFFLNLAKKSHLRGLANDFNDSTNSIRLELNNLTEAGYLIKKKEKNKVNYLANDKHPKRWLSIVELERCKRGPGFRAKVKKMKGRMSELKPVFVEYVNTQTQYQSCNTPQQWTCKFDDWLFNEYEFTNQELDELRSDKNRQGGCKTSEKVTNG